MYKDKDKQREAVKQATQRWRERCVRGMVQGQGITSDRVSQVTRKVSPTQPEQPKSQSYNPMMIGYVPPTENRN